MSTFSRVSAQGTAMDEATLCDEHLNSRRAIGDEMADAADDHDPEDTRWYDTTDNLLVACIECGATS